MQMQQINFYLPEFRPSREPLRAIHMLWVLSIMLLVLIAITALTYYQYQELEHEFAKVDDMQKKMQTQLQTAMTVRPPISGPDLEQKIQRLQEELQRRNELESIITTQNLGNDKGFSAQLAALAKSSLQSISIETFSLQKGGSYAELTGKARSADQIPLYLQKLRSDPSFANVGFGVMSVARSEAASGVLQFSLAKAVEEKDEAKKASIMEKFNALLR